MRAFRRNSRRRQHVTRAAAALHVARYRTGMPQLARQGLSEHWLLKECGHRQWLSIARGQGTATPEFRDAVGHKAYAAFTMVRITAPALDGIAENDRFGIASETLCVGRSQHYGRHRVEAGGRLQAEVEMLSVFVRRERPGDNGSIVRAAVGEGSQPGPTPDPALRNAAQRLVERGRAWRGGVWQAGDGFAADRGRVLRRFTVVPCPTTDFNGADLLYFVSFQAIVERAEWAWFGTSHQLVLAERELVFHANLDVGEAVEVRLHAVCSSDDAALKHWCSLHRESDGRLLADVLTVKRALPTDQHRVAAGAQGVLF